jgi:single-stranded DNA-binding protein
MIKVEPFEAKLVRDPELREFDHGVVCKMRVRQVGSGKRSLFIDIAVFVEEHARKCAERLGKDSVVAVSDAGLIYEQWDGPPARKGGKPQPRSKHALVAGSVVPAQE